MKKSIFLSVSLVLISFISTAQNNTFPTTGNVGIGTTTPDQALVVKGSISFDYGDTKSYNGFRLIGPKTEYYNIITGGTAVIHEFTGSLGSIMSLTNDGKVGIGTTTPSSKLHVNSTEKNAFRVYKEGVSDKYLNVWHGSSGAVIEPIKENGGTSELYIGGYENPTNLYLSTNGGNVGIGTSTPDSKLAVNGKIHAKEVKVDLTGWPDYVFENNYNLPTLQEVENHIVEEGHLPNIPSASEVEKNGIQLGEMNAKLLQKIEELTLYMIAQNKKTEQLQKEIELLKQKNIELEKK
ncbi:tail fiber protein [Aquimarina megaterium]|uniref:tail fiber protein n=1 Tax=Aquimarina megaterium TaxID=1443666 RepID=UPI000470F424|nr:tail fiber protein [Aquimarina megaterium]